MSRVDYSIIGKRFGSLVVKEYSHTGNNSLTFWKCLCDCGKMIVVHRQSLISGDRKTCGRSKKYYTCDNNVNDRILYHRWYSMKSRCNKKKNKKYKYYGARGIAVCNEWLNDFNTFKKWAHDIGWIPDLQVHRVDNNGDYCPENCILIKPDSHTKLHQDQQRTVNPKTGYYNVYYHKKTNTYRVMLLINKDKYEAYRFKTAKDAAEAYNHIVRSNNLKRPLNII